MPLTPADIHNVAFKKPPIGKRGYDEEEVDAFLDEVEHELIRLLEENEALRGQLQHGGDGPAAATMVMGPELAELSAQLERMQEARARAEQNARGVQAELERARRGAASAPPSGVDDDRNSRVLMMAQRTADEHLRDANTESQELVTDARTKAEQIGVEAQRTAGTIESDARRQHSETVQNIGAKRAAMLEEINRLGHLARSYHGALSEHLTQQLRELNTAPDAA